MRAIVRHVLWFGTLLIVLLGATPAWGQPVSRKEAIAKFDTLAWPQGGRGVEGRKRALRAAGFKPTKKKPVLRVDIAGGNVRVTELHTVSSPPCPPCKCSGEGAARRCAPCVLCQHQTRVTFSATWSRDGDRDDPVTQVGPVLEP